VLLDFALKNGRAVAFPVINGIFERRFSAPTETNSTERRDSIIEQIKDVRRTLDYLEQERLDIDPESFAFFGHSWGSTRGPLALVVEPRFKAGILYAAGLNEPFDAIPEVDPVNYLPRVDVPVLMLSGRYDTVFPLETAAQPFYELLSRDTGAPKEHIYEDTGHFVSRPRLISETLRWLNTYLGQPGQ